MQSTQEDSQTEARGEIMRLYKLADEAKLAAVQHEAKLLAHELLALMDEHPEVTSLQYEIDHDYDRRSNDYFPIVNLRFYVDEVEVDEDWVWQAEQTHGWSREALETMGDEDDVLTRDDLRKLVADS